jgi:hypothetical protein
MILNTMKILLGEVFVFTFKLYGFMASKVIEKLGGIETGQGK